MILGLPRLCALLVALFAGTPHLVRSQSINECQALTDHYLEKHHKEAQPYTGSNLLYFLHVPRTAGRTFHSCLLKMGVHPARRCPKAYDHLRISNMSMPNCYLLSSHDDFSVVSMLPPDVAVITQLRDPLDRFLSAYEFAIEVAARSVRRPRHYRKKVGRIATEDVWPWSYLVPFFINDMRPRVAKAMAEVVPEEGVWVEIEVDGELAFYNRALNETKYELTDEERLQGGGLRPLLNPYDNDLVMSLKDFANHPIALELLHNGATFQVLGITNYSHWGDAGGFRSCLLKYDALRGQMLSVAQDRIRRFTHVGTTDRLYDSAASALVSMGLSVDSPAYAGGDEDVVGRGGVRRRAEDVRQGQQGQGQGEAGGRVLDNEVAAKMSLLAKLIREARRRLQTAQRELAESQRARADLGMIERLRNRVESVRNELIEAQEKLAALRDTLPTELGGRGAQSQMEAELDGEAVAAQAARRRLLAVDDTSEGQEQQQEEGQGSSGIDGGAGAAEGSSAQVSGTTAESGSAAESGSGSGLGLGSAESEKLVDEVAEQRRRLASKVVVPSTDAFGNILDPEFKKIAGSNAGNEFVRCASRAQQRSSSRRDQSLAAVSHADGRRLSFSKAARKRIPQEVLDLIHSYNTMDTPLHQLGLTLLNDHIEQQKAEGLFRDLPALDVQAGRRRTGRAGKVQGDRQSNLDELR